MLNHPVKVLSAALGALIVFAAPAFAANHKHSAMSAMAMANDSSAVITDNGVIIGADPDPNIRFALKREGHLDAD